VKRPNSFREAEKVSAYYDPTVEEAERILRKLVRHEAGKCAGDVEVAKFRVEAMYGIDGSAVRSLWKRAKELKSVKGRILDRLRQADEWLKETAARERGIAKDVAESLERRGSPAARLARSLVELGELADAPPEG